MRALLLFSIVFLMAASLAAAEGVSSAKFEELDGRLQEMKGRIDTQQTKILTMQAKAEMNAKQAYERIFLATDSIVQLEKGLKHKIEDKKILIEDKGKEYQLELDEEYAKAKAEGELKKVELRTEADKLVYKVKTVQSRKFLGLIKMNMPVTTFVDAKTGDAEEKMPWYGFMFKEINQTGQ
ncbi:hypothetical protein ACFL96_11050 [Thermoproteota archaeon]